MFPFKFLELSEESSTLISYNPNQIIESIETSTPSPALPVRADNDESEDEDAVIRPSMSMDDEDSSLKQIFVVSDETDIAYEVCKVILYNISVSPTKGKIDCTILALQFSGLS